MLGELLCIVDREDRVLKGERREIVHDSGLWHRGVHIFLCNEDNGLLVTRRSATKDKFPSRLDCSVSEHVRLGETYEDAARRGLREELDIDASPQFLLRFRMRYGPGDNMVCKLFECRSRSAPKPGGNEVSEVMFLSLDDVRRCAPEKPSKADPLVRGNPKVETRIERQARISGLSTVP